MPEPIAFKNIPFNASFPEELKGIVAEWPEIYKSPYSLSLYNTGDKDWNHTPEGSLRVSDHWNFRDSEGRLHCRTRGLRPKKGLWALARFTDGAYVVISIYNRANPRRARALARKRKGII